MKNNNFIFQYVQAVIDFFFPLTLTSYIVIFLVTTYVVVWDIRRRKNKVKNSDVSKVDKNDPENLLFKKDDPLANGYNAPVQDL